MAWSVMSVDLEQNVTLRGERELVERAGHLFAGAQEEFVCAATLGLTP